MASGESIVPLSTQTATCPSGSSQEIAAVVADAAKRNVFFTVLSLAYCRLLFFFYFSNSSLKTKRAQLLNIVESIKWYTAIYYCCSYAYVCDLLNYLFIFEN